MMMQQLATSSATTIITAILVGYFVLSGFQYLFNFQRIVRKVLPYILLGFVSYRGYLVFNNEKPGMDILSTLEKSIENYPICTYLLKDIFGIYLVLSLFYYLSKSIRWLRCLTWMETKNIVGGGIISLASQIPMVASKIQDETLKIEKHLEESLKGKEPREQLHNLPKKGRSDKIIMEEMKKASEEEDKKWKSGRVSGAVYHGENDHLAVLNKVYEFYSVSNPLHADIWPSVMKYEAEVISMTANLLNGGDQNVCGVLTSGGTESIVLAAKTHRQWFKQEKGVHRPEIIAPFTAHAGIDKACDILGIQLIKVPVDPITFQVDVNAVRSNITADTIMIYSSAPNFPQGTIDNIEALSALAVRYGVGLHVDCCLGGFFLPFAEKAGYSFPKYNFELPGVTSMSCDSHKYGYASKGTSVVLYRNKSIRRHQYFCFPQWSGGLYVTPTIAGSRSGALSAIAWASMVRLGEEGYVDKVKEIMETAIQIRDGIEKISGLYVLGNPKAMVICFSSKICNIYEIGDKMTAKGWSLNSLQHPRSIHICVTIRHIGFAQMFLDDLAHAIKEVIENPHPKKGKGGSAMYGMAATMPAGPVEEILRAYTDVTLKV